MGTVQLVTAGPYTICLACDAASSVWEPLEHDADCPALSDED